MIDFNRENLAGSQRPLPEAAAGSAPGPVAAIYPPIEFQLAFQEVAAQMERFIAQGLAHDPRRQCLIAHDASRSLVQLYKLAQVLTEP